MTQKFSLSVISIRKQSATFSPVKKSSIIKDQVKEIKFSIQKNFLYFFPFSDVSQIREKLQWVQSSAMPVDSNETIKCPVVTDITFETM